MFYNRLPAQYVKRNVYYQHFLLMVVYYSILALHGIMIPDECQYGSLTSAEEKCIVVVLIGGKILLWLALINCELYCFALTFYFYSRNEVLYIVEMNF